MLQRPLPRIATLQRGEQYVAADASVKSKRVYPETVRPASDRQTVRPSDRQTVRPSDRQAVAVILETQINGTKKTLNSGQPLESLAIHAGTRANQRGT